MKGERDDIPSDPDAPASEEELAAAADLKLALEDPSRASEEADLARALSVAHAPREIPGSVHSAIIAKSLEKIAARDASRGRVIRVAFGATAVLAFAASVFFWIRNGTPSDVGPATTMTAAAAVPLVQVRSTAPLFDAPFDATSTSARIDRIALARSDDLRENMYASWGVK